MRYATFKTGIVDTGDPYTCDQRAWFPFEIDTAGSDVVPLIDFTRDEYVEFVYRVRQYSVDISLTFTTGDAAIGAFDTFEVFPDDADEREIPRNYLSLGTSGTGTVPAIGQAIYIPLTRLFRINYNYSTPVLLNGNAVYSQPGTGRVATGATLEIFGHVTTLYEEDAPALPTGVSGSIIIQPTDWREYRDRDDLNPIWYANSGALLIDPVPGDLG
jgi:hypothetical protein